MTLDKQEGCFICTPPPTDYIRIMWICGPCQEKVRKFFNPQESDGELITHLGDDGILRMYRKPAVEPDSRSSLVADSEIDKDKKYDAPLRTEGQLIDELREVDFEEVEATTEEQIEEQQAEYAEAHEAKKDHDKVSPYDPLLADLELDFANLVQINNYVKSNGGFRPKYWKTVERINEKYQIVPEVDDYSRKDLLREMLFRIDSPADMITSNTPRKV